MGRGSPRPARLHHAPASPQRRPSPSRTLPSLEGEPRLRSIKPPGHPHPRQQCLSMATSCRWGAKGRSSVSVDDRLAARAGPSQVFKGSSVTPCIGQNLSLVKKLCPKRESGAPLVVHAVLAATAQDQASSASPKPGFLSAQAATTARTAGRLAYGGLPVCTRRRRPPGLFARASTPDPLPARRPVARPVAHYRQSATPGPHADARASSSP